ncbi:epoxide hydrolase-like protein [Phyllosticta citriasiana]|uniref:Epoxide hydrolase-like protein n=1 Tax=Phyllosticta citriasiana TaxID=595635 RepID=A0ABR1KE43_9PEZI
MSPSSSFPAPGPTQPKIKALLFDIGGVVVLSPLAAITTYEQHLHLPGGYINSAISAAAPTGAFQRLERGEIPLDDAFFEQFGRDVRNREVWRRVVANNHKQREQQQRRRGRGELVLELEGLGEEELEKEFKKATSPIDPRALFWTMMRAARHPDPHIYPALLKLIQTGRARAGSSDPRIRDAAFVVGALSNAVVFPPGTRDERGELFDAGVVLRGPSSSSSSSSSNDNKTKTETEASQTSPIPPLFDVFLHSAYLGLRKPDPRIYTLAIQRLSLVMQERGLLAPSEMLRPQEVLFLDDIGVNLKGARQVGLRTCKVEIGRTREAVRVLEGAVGVRF